jgi:hypothetical protein
LNGEEHEDCVQLDTDYFSEVPSVGCSPFADPDTTVALRNATLTLPDAAYRLEPGAVFYVARGDSEHGSFLAGDAADRQGVVYSAMRGFRDNCRDEPALNETLAALVEICGTACLLDTDDRGCVALHWLAAQKSPRALEYALKALSGLAVDVDTRDGGGCTPLHYAALMRDRESIDVLLQYKANPYSKNRAGIAPIDYFGLDVTSRLKDKTTTSS